jgi:hypothetical protein
LASGLKHCVALEQRFGLGTDRRLGKQQGVFVELGEQLERIGL